MIGCVIVTSTKNLPAFKLSTLAYISHGQTLANLQNVYYSNLKNKFKASKGNNMAGARLAKMVECVP